MNQKIADYIKGHIILGDSIDIARKNLLSQGCNIVDLEETVQSIKQSNFWKEKDKIISKLRSKKTLLDFVKAKIDEGSSVDVLLKNLEKYGYDLELVKRSLGVREKVKGVSKEKIETEPTKIGLLEKQVSDIKAVLLGQKIKEKYSLYIELLITFSVLVGVLIFTANQFSQLQGLADYIGISFLASTGRWLWIGAIICMGITGYLAIIFIRFFLLRRKKQSEKKRNESKKKTESKTKTRSSKKAKPKKKISRIDY